MATGPPWLGPNPPEVISPIVAVPSVIWVCSRAGALPEVVRDGAEAILVPPGDRRALMGALALLTRDRARLAGMAEKALARARELPTWADTQSEFAAAIGVS